MSTRGNQMHVLWAEIWPTAVSHITEKAKSTASGALSDSLFWCDPERTSIGIGNFLVNL